MSKVLKQLFKEELEQAGRKVSHLRLVPPPPPPPDLGHFSVKKSAKPRNSQVRLYFLFIVFLCTAGYSYWLITEGRKIEKAGFQVTKTRPKKAVILNSSPQKSQDVPESEADWLVQEASASLNREGIRLFKNRKYAEAALVFARSAEIDSLNPLSLINLGMAKTKLREFRSAKEALTKAGKLLGSGTPLSGAPKLEVVFNNLGGLQLEEKNFGPAILSFQRAIQLKPDYLDARLNLAKAMELSGRPIDAAQEYQETLGLTDLNPAIRPVIEKRLSKINAFVDYLREEEAAGMESRESWDQDESE